MIKLLKARERSTEFFYQIHIDDSKTVDDPEDPAPLIADPQDASKQIPDPAHTPNQIPDPKFLREYHWGKDVREADREREMAALVALELSRMTSETTLAKEGEVL